MIYIEPHLLVMLKKGEVIDITPSGHHQCLKGDGLTVDGYFFEVLRFVDYPAKGKSVLTLKFHGKDNDAA